jgi:ABC-2 type transport system ATP-binding protein
MIEARGLVKRYGPTIAVDHLSFDVRPGTVTGFLGPNGAGKSTTMRMMLGLDRPDAGTARINGQDYRDLRCPLREVGALLEARAFHPGRTARAHLTALAASNRIPRRRVSDVLEVTGMEKAADRRAGKFSLGMSQRLGIAAALLGDPQVLLLDEPVNGLDPEGVRWIRTMLKNLASEGRTVLVSSHLMSEMQHTADHLVVIGRGRLIADESLASFAERSTQRTLTVRTPDRDRFATALRDHDAEVRVAEDGALTIAGLDARVVGDLAFAHNVPLHELSINASSLEAAFMTTTADSLEYATGARP